MSRPVSTNGKCNYSNGVGFAVRNCSNSGLAIEDTRNIKFGKSATCHVTVSNSDSGSINNNNNNHNNGERRAYVGIQCHPCPHAT